jgi:uncharacterized protein (UPF0332 family)
VYEDLLSQAELLATADAFRPKQANLRRAVSATYYAVFHLLVEEACVMVFGSQSAHRPYRHALARAFGHASMKTACSSFGGGNLKSSVAKGLPKTVMGVYVIPREIREIAAAFTELQEKRHLADYDRSERFKRLEVLTLIDETKIVVARFLALPDSNDRRFFLACLWAWKDLVNR